ncbi:hypothetical protein ANN_11922 [Periplaneta americana]|uniref:Uncharacterized protein n=1 Tax=Periplaneta americana TaxID=6978 RepID=A0ABQ8T7I3_PERAM|nr:hypothetical protein ANN_11922 [Periplaneta americana]
MRLGATIPNFDANTTKGPINFYEWQGDSYSPQNWLHLYTDGSLISREQGAGASVTCCLFSLCRSLRYRTTSFDGEIVAISKSLRNLLCHINKFKNAVIFSDSKAAILSIVSKHTPSSQTAEITKMLSQLISLNKRIVFQWIPSHCGILGNENVDALAKKGSTATYRPVTKSMYYSVKRFIKSTYLDFNKQNLTTQSQGKKWNSLHHNPQLIPDLPRKSSVPAFRLATGHDCLTKHLHRIGIYQSLNCPLCNSNQEMDSEHLKIFFTPVCTTEIGAIASYSNEFKKRGVKVITLSCEKLDSHLDWNADINSYCNIPEDFPYPMVADETRELAIKLDLIDENSKDNPKEAKMVRAVYIIAPDHTVKMLMMYPGLAGRNVDEILRVIDSLQLTSRLKIVATPANWTPGTKVLILPRVKDEELPELFPKGVEKVNLPSGRSYNVISKNCEEDRFQVLHFLAQSFCILSCVHFCTSLKTFSVFRISALSNLMASRCCEFHRCDGVTDAPPVSHRCHQLTELVAVAISESDWFLYRAGISKRMTSCTVVSWRFQPATINVPSQSCTSRQLLDKGRDVSWWNGGQTYPPSLFLQSCQTVLEQLHLCLQRSEITFSSQMSKLRS